MPSETPMRITYCPVCREMGTHVAHHLDRSVATCPNGHEYDPFAPTCGRIMPRTYPPGRYVCEEPAGHTGPHNAKLDGGGGVAMWTDDGRQAWEAGTRLPASPPPGEGRETPPPMTDERLAELRAIRQRAAALNWTTTVAAFDDMLAEIARLRPLASLGEALVAAARETEQERRTLSIWRGYREWNVHNLDALGHDVPSDRTRALRDALREAMEGTR